MKNRTNTVILLAAIVVSGMLLASNQTFAQRMRMSIDDRVKQLTEQLSLTDAQADSVRVIYQQADSARAKIFNTNRGDRDSMRAMMGSIRDTVNAQIKTLLNDKQKAQYDEILKSRPRMMRGARSRGRSEEQ
jgi:Spy/CpxP family protein refolding chaperone